MIQTWLLLLPLLFVAVLAGVAYAGDHRSAHLQGARVRPVVYSLALATYCSSWTFYGAVGSAARNGITYVAVYLGPILLFVFGFGVLRRLAGVVRRRKLTSIADFIGARYNQSHVLAALVAVIAVAAVVPYIALQFDAVATSYAVLERSGVGATSGPGVDGGLWCAVLLTVFAIVFGTRGADAAEHHHGMVLAVAVSALATVSVLALLAGYALWHGPGLAASVRPPLTELAHDPSPAFLAQVLLGFCAIACLPRAFQIGMVESGDPADLDCARWLVPLYLVIVALATLPIAAAGAALPRLRGMSPDSWVLGLPLAFGNHGIAVLTFVGGFAAATGMVVVALVALSIMISNDLVLPALLRVRRLQLDGGGDLSQLVSWTRRLAIVLVAAIAYAFWRATPRTAGLADFGLLAFTGAAQFAPAVLAAVYWRGASARGVALGLVAGFAVWGYALLLPTLTHAAQWLPGAASGTGWDAVTRATFWSLLANAACLLLGSLRFRPSLRERLYAERFLDDDTGGGTIGSWSGRVRTADLRTVAERIVGERRSARAFAAYARVRGRRLAADEVADPGLIQYTERLLASSVGAANGRRILAGALSGSGLDIANSMALLDEASQELRFNRELLATTLEHVAQGVSVVDAEMRLVAWNRRYLDLFDYPPGLVHVGVPIARLIRWNAERGECGPGEVDDHVVRRIAHLRAGSPHVFQRVRPDGTVIEMRGHALADRGYVTTYSDVTVYKHTEQALREVNETLEQRVAQRTAELSEALAATAEARRAAELANATRTRFLAAASHDLLQPLHAARLFTSALRAQPGLEAEAAQLAERIDASFNAAEGLLQALLDMSRLDAGRYRPELANVALADLFGSLQVQFAVVARQRGLRLNVVRTRLAVRSDPQLLRRILQNFLSNALRYTARGGVLLGARRAGAWIRLEVWDTGPGIAAAQRTRIFEEFQRLDQASPWGEKGLGLGLSICDRLAGILGHRLDVRSRIGRGSCFAVTVPTGDAQPPRDRRMARSVPGQRLALTVLCVDNDAAVLDAMRALLGRWGVDCRVALDVAQAQAELARGGIDLMLADCHLAGDVDGLQALQQLGGTLGRLPPVVVITADGSSALQQRARQLGYQVLHKPVRPAALRALLTASLRKPVA